MENISQSLAGRTAIARLLPFDITEAYPSPGNLLSIDEVLYTGFYPRIFDKKLNATEAMSFYVNTYIERDVRRLVNVKDMSKFEVFMKLCAGRTGQILNFSNLGNDCGIDQTTVKRWLSVLEASYIIKLLKPFYKNFNKRLIKSPKLYFLDTGLVSYLLGIQNETQLVSHPLKGALFESFVVSEILKKRFNAGKTDNLFYFRDNVGNEVDLVIDNGVSVDQIEIKSGQTVNKDYFKGINYFKKLNPGISRSFIIYGGDQSYMEKDVSISSWVNLNKIDF